MNILNLFKKSIKKDDSSGDTITDTITALKPTRKKEKESTFIGDFDITKKHVSSKKNASSLILEEDRIVSRPVLSNSLVTHICISLDSPVFRPDLEFIANSRIDGKPIYKYIGNDFSKFNLPYEEIYSIS
jgi:hypothetical protein